MPESKPAIIGSRYGRLTLTADLGIIDGARWCQFQCDCGTEKKIRFNSVVTRNMTKSCGCLSLVANAAMAKHRDCTTKLYGRWISMRKRCNSTRYKYYGGKGIKVCKEWDVFLNFKEWAIKNGYKDELTIDRIDGNGNYEPSNCRWISNKEQQNNLKSNKKITYEGKEYTVTQLAEKFNIEPWFIHSRLGRGWSIHQALFAPKYRKSAVTP